MEKDYGQFHLRGENSKMLLEAQTCRLDQCKPQGCISQVSHGARQEERSTFMKSIKEQIVCFSTI